MSAREPFPKLIRLGLLVPLAIFVACWIVALLTKGNQVTGGAWLMAMGAAALVELVAIPAAVFLLIRDARRYASWGNVLMTLAAAVPVVMASFVVLMFSGALGTFHI